MKKYSLETKLAAVKSYLEGKHLFETQGIDALQSKKKERSPMKKASKKKQPVEGSKEALQSEIEQLRMENAYLKKVTSLNSEKEKVTEQGKSLAVYELRHEYKIIDLVKMAGIPRSTYYHWIK